MLQENLLEEIELAEREGKTELDLSGKQLSTLPPEIGKLTQLKKLILGKYRYDEKGDIIDYIGNNLSELPVEIGLLSHLEELQIVGNQLSSLPSEIGSLTNLQSLDISYNQLSSLPSEIGSLTNLQTLYLHNNQLSSLPLEFVQLTNLQTLSLHNNQLSSLPSEIGSLTNLQNLYLHNNQLGSLPSEIGSLTNLQNLYLHNNQLGSLPSEIVSLTNLQILSLGGNQLSSLPSEIGSLTNLQNLYLHNNQLGSLPSEIGSLTNLQNLYLHNNQLGSLPSEIGSLINLQNLSLDNNQLSSLPSEIVSLTNLQSLSLDNNQLSSLPSEFGSLTNLQSLSLDNNQLSSLPSEFGSLTNLHILCIRYNDQLSSLPSEFGSLTNLQSLNIYNNQLSSLPSEIVSLTNLQSLNIYNNQLSSLPSEIGFLTNLQTLDISRNQLSSLPSEIGSLTNLQTLNIRENQLSSLPSEIGSLTNLQSLDIRNNQLSSLPSEIASLTNLQSLDIRNNQLSSLPSEIGSLTNLQTLDIGFNRLSSLPSEFGSLTNLQSLYIYNNQLSSLPSEIVSLTNLQFLYIYNNQLSSLPSEFGSLTNLQFLDISNNQLSSLPSEIGFLTNLQSLYISNNQLSSLPSEIRLLPKLEELDLRGNPVPIPPEILSSKNRRRDLLGDVKEILDFYFRVQDPSEAEPFYEAKFLIIGEGGAGKTSLAKKIKDENYYLQSDEKSTEGIDVIQWHFTQPNGKDFRVNIWDFGGQEIYHKTHQFFLTKRSLYALVADTRTQNTDFYWWLKVAELLSDSSPILIIKNEKQDRQCEVNERSLRGEFLNLKEILPANLATNRGLDKIKEKIQLYISTLPHVGLPLPKIWVRVRSALENDSRNYISLGEYYQLCRENSLSDRQDMLRLSRYLHDLGVCLHFQDDAILKHYVILKPEWGTTAVYKVLDNKTVSNNLGRFTQENLVEIWEESEYADMRDELLQLMIRFKLCYPIRDRPNHYIAPQLLDVNQPNYTWNDKNNLILSYKYEFMPKGILTRFIVETHPWIEQQKLVWRSGVVLNKDETRAEVIEHYNQKEIKIRVTGNRKKELLAVVTHKLEEIHQSFKGLEYNTLVPCNCTKCEGNQTPSTYTQQELHEFLKAGDYQIQCRKSHKMVDVRRLIDDVNLPPLEGNREVNRQSTPLQQELKDDRDESLSSVTAQPTMNYQDFQVLVTADRKIRVSSEQGEEQGELRLDMSKINLALKLIEQKATNKDLLKGLGGELYQALFPNKIYGQLRATMAGAQAGNYKVRLRLVFESPELAALPWEFLYDEGTNTFLGNNTQTVLSRYIDIPLKKRELKARSSPLSILLVISSPTNLPQLDVDGEEKLLRSALAKYIDAGTIQLKVLREPTISNINQKLREQPYNVFHFIGHGIFENNKGYIALVDDNGKEKRLDDEGFANFFLGNNNLGLVVLNSCQGATVSSQQAFAGIAPNLVRREIPAVVAMQYSIKDTTAKLFADEFYRTLALGWPIDAAIQTTRNGISIEVGLEQRDFATPVLYMRAKDGIIMSGL